MRRVVLAIAFAAQLSGPSLAGAQEPSRPPAAPPAPSPSVDAAQPTTPPPPGATTAPVPGWGPPPPGGYPPPPPGGYPPPGDAPPRWAYPVYAQPPRAEVLPDRRPYREGAPVPPGYHVETHVNKGPVIAGSVVFGTTYLASAAIGALALDHGNSELYPMLIPIAGPFITLGTLDMDHPMGGFYAVVVGFPLITDGLAQTVGAIALVAGLASPRQSLVRDGAAQDTAPRVRFAGDRVLVEGRF